MNLDTSATTVRLKSVTRCVSVHHLALSRSLLPKKCEEVCCEPSLLSCFKQGIEKQRNCFARHIQAITSKGAEKQGALSLHRFVSKCVKLHSKKDRSVRDWL